MFREIFATAKPSDLIITANRRLANRIEQFVHQKTNSNDTTWIKANVVSVNDWTQSLWLELGDRSVLTTTEALLLWQEIISDANPEFEHSKASLAETCLQAHNLLQQHAISTPILQQHCINDTHTQLLKWLSLFDEALQDRNSITNNMIIGQLLAHTSISVTTRNQKQLFLYGFESIPTNLQALLTKLSSNCSITNCETPQRNTNILRTECNDEACELELMAQWAKQMAQQGQQRIACIVPNLEQKRSQLDALFENTLNEHGIHYNISSGVSLNTHGMIDTALTVLKLKPNRLDTEQLLHCVASPYLSGNVTDQAAAALLRQMLLDKGKKHHSSASLLPILQYIETRLPKASLPTRLQNWLKLDHPRRFNTSSDWTAYVCDTLNTIGWPGQRGFNSTEHQLYEHWQQTLLTTCQQMQHTANSTHNEYLYALTFETSHHLFHEKTPECSIQILGILEATGNDFDCAWISGINEHSWPAPAQPNPLIPYSLQRQVNMPHANSERELNYCRAITNILCQSIPQVVISHATQHAGMTAAASSLSQHIQASSNSDIATYACTQATPPQNEPLRIEEALLFPIQDNECIRGGSWILSQQANCPFQAFARVRLHASPLGELQDSIDALEKGSLIHRVLELFWQQTQTQQALVALSSEACLERINDCIEQAFTESDKASHALFVETERNRIRHVMQQWLELEKQRPPFRVAATEKRFNACINDLPLHTIVDRIDQLDSGETIIIDYKTGKQSINGWLDERLSAPQLPLYSALPDVETDAICYAELKRGQYTFNGIGSDGIDHPGIRPIAQLKDPDTPNWSTLLNRWQHQLSSLATSFINGDASITPNEDTNPCDWCDLHSVCRINQA